MKKIITTIIVSAVVGAIVKALTGREKTTAPAKSHKHTGVREEKYLRLHKQAH